MSLQQSDTVVTFKYMKYIVNNNNDSNNKSNSKSKNGYDF